MQRLFRVILAALLLTFGAAAHAQKRIALTFDDIPRHQGAFMQPAERATKLIAALKLAKVKQAAFFLNPGSLAMPSGAGGEGRISAYVAAGHVIANHTNNHPPLSGLSVEAYLANIDAAEAWLKGRTGRRPWFRFPFLDEGNLDTVKRDAIRAGLAARGLRNGYVTADGSDWFLDDLTIKAAKDGKQMDMEALKRLYISMHVSGAEYADDLARQVLGRSPAHVMLMHETDIAALFLPDMVAELRRNGWTIITADEAYRDALKSVFPKPERAHGPVIQMMAAEKNLMAHPWPFRVHPGIAEPIFKAQVLKEAAAK